MHCCKIKLPLRRIGLMFQKKKNRLSMDDEPLAATIQHQLENYLMLDNVDKLMYAEVINISVLEIPCCSMGLISASCPFSM